eukprot:CAMPEP_0202925248 /NCGR_PEP_ID=MMETSP1392-20130828/79399_1 /ASSEMBLY_ACC=CAM_ASM_000868 /TAXON_ID=225041 /ORGANISM="Chlamydomonas chlamydogama, Strain SAG 11-48b" /LENGTH=275 /DNA_ID=CAMNT_0049619017 /DNA_START=114 /DNA_END=940 /DNA_ORIENTATION=+
MSSEWKKVTYLPLRTSKPLAELLTKCASSGLKLSTYGPLLLSNGRSALRHFVIPQLTEDATETRKCQFRVNELQCAIVTVKEALSRVCPARAYAQDATTSAIREQLEMLIRILQVAVQDFTRRLEAPCVTLSQVHGRKHLFSNACTLLFMLHRGLPSLYDWHAEEWLSQDWELPAYVWVRLGVPRLPRRTVPVQHYNYPEDDIWSIGWSDYDVYRKPDSLYDSDEGVEAAPAAQQPGGVLGAALGQAQAEQPLPGQQKGAQEPRGSRGPGTGQEA